MSAFARTRQLSLAASLILCALAAADAAAAHQDRVLYSFKGGIDAQSPLFGSLTADTDGDLYGTTDRGGTYGLGTVFKVALDGTETVIHSFAGAEQGDGSTPFGGVILDPSGNLYGT